MPQTEYIKLHILVVNSNITGVATGMVPRSSLMTGTAIDLREECLTPLPTGGDFYPTPP